MNEQLRFIVAYLLSTPFIHENDELKYFIKPIGLESFAYQVSEMIPFLTNYYAPNDDMSLYCHSFVKDHRVIIAEAHSFFDAETLGLNYEIYKIIDPLFTREHSLIKDEITIILGSPKYVDDRFTEYAVAHRRDDFSNAQRRDIPLEQQMVHGVGYLKLAYWTVENRVIYLGLSWEDKEEPLLITVGCRPQERE